VIKEREYYLFDLGMAISAMQLRATELGLVAHPIAGFDNEKARLALGIPDGNMVLTLVIVGMKSGDTASLNPYQAGMERVPGRRGCRWRTFSALTCIMKNWR